MGTAAVCQTSFGLDRPPTPLFYVSAAQKNQYKHAARYYTLIYRFADGYIGLAWRSFVSALSTHTTVIFRVPFSYLTILNHSIIVPLYSCLGVL
jgi:hypothetical protein